MNVEIIRAELVKLIAQCEPKSENEPRGAWYVNEGSHYQATRFAVKVEDDTYDTRHALAYEETLDAALDSAASVLHLVGWQPGMSATEAAERLRTTMRRGIFHGEPCRMTVEETVCSMGWRENKGPEFAIVDPAPGFEVHSLHYFTEWPEDVDPDPSGEWMWGPTPAPDPAAREPFRPRGFAETRQDAVEETWIAWEAENPAPKFSLDDLADP